MSQGLKRKLETAFSAWVQSKAITATPLFGINIYAGRGDLDNRTLPCVNIYCPSLSINTDYPSSSGEYIATIIANCISQADDEGTDTDDHDARQYQLEGIMKDITNAKAYINKPGTGTRPVDKLYIYDICEDEESQDFRVTGDRTLDDSLTFKIPCRNDNGDGT